MDLGPRSYDVVFADDFAGVGRRLAALAPSVVVVTDPVVASHHADRLRAELEAGGVQQRWIELPHGERHKDLVTWAGLVEQLVEPGFHRRTPVVALGGGVVGDVAGFAAATAMRGVPFVQLPTTLLAMVDSAVGGKTGVNLPAGKNLVGAFHQPALVWAALDTLDTLPDPERVAGLGEVLKTALLGDARLLDTLEQQGEALRRGDRAATLAVTARCVEIKASVVARDERESGWRAVLNAGHTFGHALETALGPERVRHGEAVAMGLIHEARWAVRHGHCLDPQLPARLTRIATSLWLPTTPPETDAEVLTECVRLDKKAGEDRLCMPVPVRAGEMVLVDVAVDRIPDLVEEPG